MSVPLSRLLPREQWLFTLTVTYYGTYPTSGFLGEDNIKSFNMSLSTYTFMLFLLRPNATREAGAVQGLGPRPGRTSLPVMDLS